MLRLVRLLMLIVILLTLGLNWVAEGIEQVVGPGPWKAIDYDPLPQGAQIQLLGKTYLLDYKPLAQALSQTATLVEEMKWRGDELWERGKGFALRVWEYAQQDGVQLTAE